MWLNACAHDYSLALLLLLLALPLQKKLLHLALKALELSERVRDRRASSRARARARCARGAASLLGLLEPRSPGIHSPPLGIGNLAVRLGTRLLLWGQLLSLNLGLGLARASREGGKERKGGGGSVH